LSGKTTALFNQNAGSVIFSLNSHGLGLAVHCERRRPAGRRTKGAFMDTMLAVLLLLMLIGQAFGGERMSCEVQPTPDGREWHHRTKVGGDPRICWYPGERMKPRSELYRAAGANEWGEQARELSFWVRR
jgi:hypothetical protein